MTLLSRVVTAVSVLFSAPVFAQQAQSDSPQTSPNAYHLSVTTQSVVLDVVVTDRQGHIMTGLTRDDFALYDDKVPQTILSFDPPPSLKHEPAPPIHSTAELDHLEAGAPVDLIVLDEINTSFKDEAFARYSLDQFLKRQEEQLDRPTMLGAVDLNHFTLLRDFTTSRQELLDALAKHKVIYPEQTEGSSWHQQQFYASFEGLLEVTQATAGHSGHKNLLWIGRGFAPFDITAQSESDMEGIRQILEACTNAMRNARVVLYTLDPAGVTTEAQSADPETGFADDFFSGELDFNKLASATGGHAFFGRNDVDKLIATSSNEGASFYTISYRPSFPVDDTHNFHNVRIAMKNPNLVAETRSGYYTHTPPAPPRVGSVHADRQVFDLGLAVKSSIPYDAIHLKVERIASDRDKFLVTINAQDVSWTRGQTGKVLTRLTVVAQTFDRQGNPIDHSLKISTLQDGEGASPTTAADPTVNLMTSVPTNSPATVVRIVIRDESTQKIGALSLQLGSAPK